jgi:hypothetical protein
MKRLTKKGNFEAVIYMGLVLFIILFLGIGLIFGAIVVDWVFDEAVPEVSNLGMVGNANLTEYASYSIAPANTFVQSFTWLAGVVYVLALAGCLGLAFAFRFTGNKWLMGLFIMIMLLVIITSIFISNIYEDFWNDNGDVGSRLQSQVLLSYLILYSPAIFTVIGFICGIIMFTGEEGEPTV